MPRLSIVLVAHREQGFLRSALCSVLEQAADVVPPDVEVVVVDDAAVDHSADIAVEVAAADPLVRVHHLASRHGPGPAHRAGLEQVTGDHVWFVEATDLLPAGALARVLDRLAATSPDVLVVGHVVRDVFGAERPGATAVAGRTAQLWDKVIGVAFLRGLDLGFAGGGDWENAVVRPVMAAATTVEVDAEPAYVRRDLPHAVRARSGPVLRTDRPGSAAAAPEPVPRSLRRRARRTLRAARRLPAGVRSAPMRAWYRAQLRAPLQDDLVVYAAYWYAAYSCNPRAIYEQARRTAPWTRGVWVVNPDKVDVVPPGVDHVVAGTRRYYRVMATAGHLVNNVNFPNDIVKRPGQVHLQTHHGTPLKTMGMDLVHSPHSRRRMNFPKLLKRVARWDYSISQNAFTSEQWERVYPSGTYESLETGYPRNDVLANATPQDVARARAELGLAAGQTAVLYTPTHREYHSGYVPQLDPARLAAALGPANVLLMRTHYFYRDGVPATGDSAGPVSGVLDVADHPRIEDLYLAADVLVTDYSSVMFDYAVLDRPVVIYAPDWEEYRTLRGTTFDLLAQPPGAVATTEAELAEALTSGRAWDDESTARRQAFRARFCSLEDGGAAERVVRRLWPAPPAPPAPTVSTGGRPRMTSELDTARRKRLVIVAGVGRSGTSLFTSILGKAGFHVPQPEVVPDSTNPKGFGEPQWVVDFHGRQLRSRRVAVWDSRPGAWADTAAAAQDSATFAELRAWLAVQFVGRDSVVVKDPRIGWFLPLWEKAAEDLGVEVSFASLLRHPAEAVSSAMTWYGDWQSPASRTLSWVNIMLETEFATRASRRVFVRYDDLLADWSAEMTRVGAALDIPVLREMPAAVRAEIDAFVDPTLHRSKVTWGDVGVPDQVRGLTEEVWKDFTALAVAGGDSADNHATLDSSRTTYHAFYTQAEAIAQSSIHALRPKTGAAGAGAGTRGPGGGAAARSRGTGADALVRVAERVLPPKVRRRVPPVWRSRIMRGANRAAQLVRR